MRLDLTEVELFDPHLDAVDHVIFPILFARSVDWLPVQFPPMPITSLDVQLAVNPFKSYGLRANLELAPVLSNGLRRARRLTLRFAVSVPLWVANFAFILTGVAKLYGNVVVLLPKEITSSMAQSGINELEPLPVPPIVLATSLLG